MGTPREPGHRPRARTRFYQATRSLELNRAPRVARLEG